VRACTCVCIVQCMWHVIFFLRGVCFLVCRQPPEVLRFVHGAHAVAFGCVPVCTCDVLCMLTRVCVSIYVYVCI